MNKLLASINREIANNPRENKSMLSAPQGGCSIRNPWKHLPNTSDFYVSVNELDPLLLKYGIARKFSPELTNIPMNNRGKAANRYLDIQFAVLLKLLNGGKSGQFWLRSMLLLSRSKVLRLVALRKLNKNWARDMSFGTVKSLLATLEVNIQTLNPKLDLTRSYVDKVKPDGTKTYRPIGAPSYADRMLLYLLSTFFVIFLGNFIGSYQHAYRPGRGVVTAWQDLKHLRDYPWIYEFDLKQFFPSVNVSAVIDSLKGNGLPECVANWIFDMSLSYPKVETLDESKLDESNAIYKAELDSLGLLHGNPKAFKQQWLNDKGEYKGRVLLPIMEFIKVNGKDLLIELMSEDLGYSKAEIEQYWWETLYEYWQVQSAMFESFAPQAQGVEAEIGGTYSHDSKFNDREAAGREPGFKVNLEPQVEGFPQGGALSPILSIYAFEVALYRGYFMDILNNIDSGYNLKLIKEKLILPGMKLVAYADDFILLCKFQISETVLLAGNKLLEIFGINFNKEKSGWIRKNGVWKVDRFKFLGITYLTKSNLIIGTPRSGKDLIFDKGGAIEEFIKRDQSLREISDHCRWGIGPQSILDKYYMAELPYTCIPEEIISTGRKATSEELQSLLQETQDPSGTSEFIFDSPPRRNQDDYIVKGMGNGWLDSPRLAGLLMNRLHSGSWGTLTSVLPELTSEEAYGRIWFENKDRIKFKPHPRSWAQLGANTYIGFRRIASMMNVSSFGTLSLLTEVSRGGQGLKIRRTQIASSVCRKHRLRSEEK
jgi:hypothetical protein